MVTAAIYTTSRELLICSSEMSVYGNTDYQDNAKMPEMEEAKAEFRVAIRPGKRQALPDTTVVKLKNLIENAEARIRSKGEYRYREIKSQIGF